MQWYSGNDRALIYQLPGCGESRLTETKGGTVAGVRRFWTLLFHRASVSRTSGSLTTFLPTRT